MVAFIPIERRMLIRWYWNAEAEEFATDEHGKTRKEEKPEELATETKHIF